MKMKPVSADIHLHYVCPKCEAKHFVRREETIFPGGLLCSCGHKLRFKPVNSITLKMNYDYKGTTLDSAAGKARKILQGYGYTGPEIIKMLTDARKVTQTEDIGELVKVSLQQIPTGV